MNKGTIVRLGTSRITILNLVKALIRFYRGKFLGNTSGRQELPQSGAAATIVDFAKAETPNDGEISRVLPLAFLAPDIVEAILHGRQPLNLTARKLKRLKPLPTSWAN